MGGKVVMKISHMIPTLIARQIVADIAPVAYTHRYDHVFEPVLKLNLDVLKKRSEADRELAKDVPDPALRAFLLQSLSSSVDGLSWKLNWPVLHQYIDEIIGYESIDDWRIDVPTLFLSGALSNYVDDDARQLIGQHFTAASFQSLENAGHWLHADQPRAFYQAAYDYLIND
jgi:pimeloyl-ACP methyl ester carboxylesterase